MNKQFIVSISGLAVVCGLLGCFCGPETQRQVAKVYFDNGFYKLKVTNNNQGALYDFNQAVRLNPERWNYHFFRAEAHARCGESSAAVQDYTEAIRIARNMTVTQDGLLVKADNIAICYRQRGLAKQQLGNTTGADKDLQTAKNIQYLIANNCPL